MFTLNGVFLIYTVLMSMFAVSLALEVFTERSVTAVLGRNISLPCNFSGDTGPEDAIYWYKHNSTGKALIARYFKGSIDPVDGVNRFNITDDYMLVISNIFVRDETTYSCDVELKGETGRGYTDVRVIALAQPLEPIIESCEVTDSGQCTYTFSKDSTQPVKLVCELRDVRPLANVTWTRSDGRLQDTADLQIFETDGLYNISSELQVSRYDFDYQYKCEAKGEAVNGITSMTAAFEAKKGLHGGLIFLIIVIVVGFATVMVVIYYKRYGFPFLPQDGIESPKPDRIDNPEDPPLPEGEIARLRRIIHEYTPGNLTDKVLKQDRKFPDHIRIAIVGATAAGKSSVIRSLKYAYSGVFSKEIEINKVTAGGAVTLEPAFYQITDSIRIQDNRGIINFDTQNIKGMMREIEREKVCLLIPIFRPQSVHEIAGDFLRDLSEAVRKKFASYPMVILTHRDKIPDESERQTIQEKVAALEILSDNVKFVENFTEEPGNESEYEDLIKEFLQILHSMLIIADSNLVQQLNK